MKKIILLFGIVLNLFGIRLDWIHSVEDALALARQKQKDVYVFVGADKCHFCERYKQKALDDPAVMQALRRRFILVYLSRDRHNVPKQFEKYGVPRHYFLKPNGEIYFADAGTKNAEGVFLMLDEAELYRAKE